MAAHELGAATAAELIARAAGLDLRATAAVGAAVLDAGDDTVGRTLDGIDSADLPRVLRAPDLEDALPAAGARAALERTCELLGTAAPAVAPSTAGLAGYAEALRLGGLALASAGASARLPVDARRLGDPALAQATAFLLEGVLTEPAWLVRVLDAADPGRVTGPAATLRLVATRAAAARAAAQGGGDREELMSRALGIPWPGELTLLDGLAGAAPADAIRARALAALLRRHLRETSGDRWFADPRSGTFLREIWLEAGDLTPESLARDLGAEGLDAVGPHRRGGLTCSACAASCCAAGRCGRGRSACATASSPTSPGGRCGTSRRAGSWRRASWTCRSTASRGRRSARTRTPSRRSRPPCRAPGSPRSAPRS